MGPHRKHVQLHIDGTDITVSIYPDDGEVRVTSAQQILDHEVNGPPRDTGHTVVVKPIGRNDKGHARSNRAKYKVTSDVEILPIER